MEKRTTLTLRRGKEESLDRFHPWVFSGALTGVPPTLEEGDVVAVAASDGRFIGVGHYQIGSIAVRILDFGDTEIDKDFFGRISAPLKPLGSKPIVPTDAEVERNPRARSAKLRVAVKV